MMINSQHIVHQFGGLTASPNYWLNELQGYEQTQLSFENTTHEVQTLKLWGNNRLAQTTSSFSISTGTAPELIAYNPFNNLIYTVNQLEGSITVVAPGEKEGITVLLEEPNNYPSPLAIAVNTSNGDVFVIGSLSNKIYLIDQELSVKTEIAIDNRPFAIALNPVNQKLYVSHLLTPQLTVIDLASLSIEKRINLSEIATAITVNEQTGNFLTIHQDQNKITLFDKEGQEIKNAIEIGNRPTKAVYSQSNNSYYIIAEGSKELLQLDSEELTVTKQVQLEDTPIGLSLTNGNNPTVLLEESKLFNRYNTELELQESQAIDEVHPSFYLDESAEQLYVPDPTHSKVNRLSISENQAAIIANSDYNEVLEEFKYEPAKVAHVKVQFSGLPLAPIFRIGTNSTRGKEASKVISLCKFLSPQHFSRIFEVSDFKDEIIDGNTFWEIDIPPQQHLSLLLYYEQ